MTTKETNSYLTSEANALLECFVSGIDDVVYEIAEKIAEARQPKAATAGLQISMEDVRQAANAVFEAIKAQAGKGIIPREVADEIEDMHQCVLVKCRMKSNS